MYVADVFNDGHNQAVGIPAQLHLPDGVKQVYVRANGRERIIAPLGATWDSFFLQASPVSGDFMQERGDQAQPAREQF